MVVSEHDFQLWRQSNFRKGRLALDQIPDLSQFSAAYLNRFDAEVFPASRLNDPLVGEFYRSRVARVPANRVIVIEPKWFLSWGPSLVTVLHPLKPLGRPTSGAWVRSAHDRNLYLATFPESDVMKGIVSLEFGLPKRKVGVDIEAGDQKLKSVTFKTSTHNRHQTTPRFRLTPEVVMRLEAPKRAAEIPFVVKRWRRPKSVSRPAESE